jgi:predicted phosphoribosyltransferase
MFRNREEAAFRLADVLKRREKPLKDPLVLAVPRGGVVIGAVLAQELGADLDVMLARKLRAPGQPEAAIGAIGEDGSVYLDPFAEELLIANDTYLSRERAHQLAEIERRKMLFRGSRPPAPIAGRSVIVADDGIATGATLIAALHAVRSHHPAEVIVAVPVASPKALEEVRRSCNEVVCLSAPRLFWSVGQYYRDFTTVEDEYVCQLLRAYQLASERDLLIKDNDSSAKDQESEVREVDSAGIP